MSRLVGDDHTIFMHFLKTARANYLKPKQYLKAFIVNAQNKLKKSPKRKKPEYVKHIGKLSTLK